MRRRKQLNNESTKQVADQIVKRSLASIQHHFLGKYHQPTKNALHLTNRICADSEGGCFDRDRISEPLPTSTKTTAELGHELLSSLAPRHHVKATLCLHKGKVSGDFSNSRRQTAKGTAGLGCDDNGYPQRKHIPYPTALCGCARKLSRDGTCCVVLFF